MFEKLKYLKEPEYFERIHKPFLLVRERFVKNVKNKKLKKYFKASMHSVMEMLHYLFLFDVSIFKNNIKKMGEGKSLEIIYHLVIITTSAQFISDELPELSEDENEKMVDIIRKNFKKNREEVEKNLNEIINLFGKKELYKLTYSNFIKCIGIKENLEESITFGILLNQMINDCILKSKKLLSK